MKKLRLIILVLFLSKTSFGQTEKGRFIFGANVLASGYNKNHSSTLYSNPSYNGLELTNTFFSGSISPFAGKFLVNNFLAGVGLSASVSNFKTISKDESYHSTQKSQGYGVAALTKYFFGDGLNGKPFLELSLNAGIGPSKFEAETLSSNYESTSTLKNLGASFSGGYAIFLNDSFILSFGVGYNISRGKEDGSIQDSSNTDFTSKTKNNGFAFGVSISTTFAK